VREVSSGFDSMVGHQYASSLTNCLGTRVSAAYNLYILHGVTVR